MKPQSGELSLRQRDLGIARGGMPNVWRGDLDEEEPRIPPPAKWWET